MSIELGLFHQENASRTSSQSVICWVLDVLTKAYLFHQLQLKARAFNGLGYIAQASPKVIHFTTKTLQVCNDALLKDRIGIG
jgi:hypothetical protein